MQHKHKPHLDCGIDGINVMFSSNYDLEQEVYRFTRNECNKEIMYAILKKLKTTNEQIEYALYVNLPKMLRNTNITPYSILDCTKYASVYQFLFDQLTQLFGMNIPELIVTGIECSFSYTLANKKLLNPMLNYITRAFISKNKGMTYAEGLYRRRHKKQVESTEDYLHRVTVAYNEIYSLINKVSDSRSYIQASNEINAFSKIVGKNATDVLKLRKQLINRIKTLIEDNDTKIQDLKQEIEDIQSFDVSDTMEEATKLDRLATNRMYELMVSFNGNSNSTKRKLGNLVLNKNGLDRISATALSRLCAIPAYADFFKPSYKEIIAEAMKSDAQKTYERNSQPVIEEKNRAIGKTYMSNFLLRKALSMANTAVSSDEVASNE